MSVYANGREISGKATPNKTIAAFPDVCLSPPSPPAGPIPIPYPLTGMASDTTDGTSSVYIKGKEAGKKNGVKYSKVTGNEPATNSFGANIVSHKITGPLRFAAYSFDVMLEKGGAERFMDLTTQNHMNSDGKSVGVDAAGLSPPPPPPPEPDCAELQGQTTAMRRATDAAQVQDYGELQRASASRNRRWQQNVESRIWTRAQGSHTACQVPGGPIRNYTSNGMNREAITQRGINVEDQAPVTNNSSRVCGGGAPYADRADKYHTESQFLEALDWNNPPASITFATNWPARTGGQIDPQRMNQPCETCRGKVLEACACGLKVYMCVGNDAVDYCEAAAAGQ